MKGPAPAAQLQQARLQQGALAVVVRVRLRNAHLRPKGAWGDLTSGRAGWRVAQSRARAVHRAVKHWSNRWWAGVMGHRKSSKTHANSLRTPLQSQPRLQQLARAQHMFAVLATAALALSGPLVGRSPHLRAPRTLLEPPAVVDPPLKVEPRTTISRGGSRPPSSISPLHARRCCDDVAADGRGQVVQDGQGLRLPRPGRRLGRRLHALLVHRRRHQLGRREVHGRRPRGVRPRDGGRQAAGQARVRILGASSPAPPPRREPPPRAEPIRERPPPPGRGQPPPYDRRDERRPGDAEYRGRGREYPNGGGGYGPPPGRGPPPPPRGPPGRGPRSARCASLRRRGGPTARPSTRARRRGRRRASSATAARRSGRSPPRAAAAGGGARRAGGSATRASSRRRRRRRAPTAATSSRTPGSSRWRRRSRPPRARRSRGLAAAMATTTATARRRRRRRRWPRRRRLRQRRGPRRDWWRR